MEELKATPNTATEDSNALQPGREKTTAHSGEAEIAQKSLVIRPTGTWLSPCTTQ